MDETKEIKINISEGYEIEKNIRLLNVLSSKRKLKK